MDFFGLGWRFNNDEHELKETPLAVIPEKFADYHRSTLKKNAGEDAFFCKNYYRYMLLTIFASHVGFACAVRFVERREKGCDAVARSFYDAITHGLTDNEKNIADSTASLDWSGLFFFLSIPA
ncbi:MAG: hypothetical protein PHI97_25800 [Desulfobulbus sp.]|nr:hypothetical protein [Desulfobulbus sp.]